MHKKSGSRNRNPNNLPSAQTRRKKRKPSKVAYLLMLLVALICVLTLLALVFLKVKTIEVTGKTTYTKSQILQASGIKNDTNILNINRNKVNEEICRILPYIKDVKVKIRPFTTVILQVSGNQARSAVAVQSGYALLDENSKVLEIQKDLKGLNLPLIKGLTVSEAEPGMKLASKDNNQVKLIAELENSLSANKIDKITEIDISNNLEIKASFESRVTILFGTSSDLFRKAKFAAYLLKNKISTQEKGSLDVSKVGTAYFDPA